MSLIMEKELSLENGKTPVNGSLLAKNSLESSLYLGDTTTIYGATKWYLRVTAKGEKEGAKVYHKDSSNRYALLRQNAYEVVLASYSKGAIAFKIKAKEDKTFSVFVGDDLGALSPVMTVDNRFWYAVKLDSHLGDKYGEKETKSKDTGTEIEKSTLLIHGEYEELKVVDGALNFNLKSGGEAFVYFGVGEKPSSRTPGQGELRRGIESRTLNYSIRLPMALGLGVGGLANILPQVFSYKVYDEHINGGAYFSQNEDMEICTLVGILSGDVVENALINYAKGGVLTALNLWIAFMRTRNHSLLENGYAVLRKKNKIGSEVDDSNFFIVDVMERASRILGKTKDNLSLNEALSRYLEKAPNRMPQKDDSPLGVFLTYLSLQRVGGGNEIEKLRERALSLFNSSKKSLSDYLYYFVALGSLFDVNYFSEDLRPSINFGTLASAEFRCSNLSAFNRRVYLASDYDGISLTLDGRKVFDLVGAPGRVSDFKEEIGGVSFNIELEKSATLTLLTPPFKKKPREESTFKLRLSSGKSKISIVNNKLSLQKA